MVPVSGARERPRGSKLSEKESWGPGMALGEVWVQTLGLASTRFLVALWTGGPWEIVWGDIGGGGETLAHGLEEPGPVLTPRPSERPLVKCPQMAVPLHTSLPPPHRPRGSLLRRQLATLSPSGHEGQQAVSRLSRWAPGLRPGLQSQLCSPCPLALPLSSRSLSFGPSSPAPPHPFPHHPAGSPCAPHSRGLFCCCSRVTSALLLLLLVSSLSSLPRFHLHCGHTGGEHPPRAPRASLSPRTR